MKTAAAIISFVVLLTACGSSGPATADQACGDLARVRCDKRDSCTNGSGITRTYGDKPTCLAREKLSCLNGLAAPSTGQSPAALETCVNSYPSFTCTDFLTNNPPAACVVTGPRAASAVCAFGGQCSTTYCTNNKQSACGTCGSAPGVGASCATSGCQRGLTCVAMTSTCQPEGAVSASCDAVHPCGPDLGCVGATATVMGSCMTTSANVGAACGGTNPPCDGTKGLHCSGTAGMRTCAKTNFVGDGQPCGTVGTDFVACSGGGDCYTAGRLIMSGESGTCKIAAKDGDPCDIVAGPPCLSPARCVVTGSSTSGICTLVDGATCT
jgi:hypothetical protein